MKSFTISLSLRGTAISAAAVILLSLVGPTASADTQWVTIRATTSQEIIDALLMASRTSIPTTVKVAPGRYEFTQAFDTGFGPSVLPAVTSNVYVIGADSGSSILDGSGVGGRMFTVLHGGALHVRGLTLTGSDWESKGVSRGGASVASFGGFLRFDDCLLLSNRTGAERGSDGGAILSVDGQLHIERSIVMDNFVEGNGGGVAVLGGSGIIRNSIISGNRARNYYGSGWGGGIYVAAGTVTVSGSTVSGNMAWSAGGGVFNAGTLWLTDSAVIENVGDTDVGDTFPGNGGGIYNSGPMRLRNVTVGANSAGSFGGGIYNDGPLVLEGSTVARNKVYRFTYNCNPERSPCSGGGGIWGNIRSVRSLLAGNTVMGDEYNGFPLAVGPDCGGGMVSSAGRNAVGNISGCILQPSYLLQGKPTNDLLAIDPLIGALQDNGDAGNGHFPLLEGSPLIDAGGADSCSGYDQIGQPRADGNGDLARECDIGAIEYAVPSIP